MAKTAPPEEFPFNIVPIISDFGFKKVIAADTPFSRKMIESLAELEAPIQSLEMMRNEFEGISIEARSGIYDVICHNEHQWVFIIEMQKEVLKYLAVRLMFYVFHFFNSQVRKGVAGFKEIPPVICICVTEANVFPEAGQFFWRFMFSDAQFGKILSNKVQVRLVELGKFPILQQDFQQVKTDFDKILYTMKYAHLIDLENELETPPFFDEPYIAEVLQKLNYAKLPPEEKAILDMAILKSKMIKAEKEEDLSEKYAEGIEKGIEKGMEKGMDSGKKQGKLEGVELTLEVIRLFKEGKPDKEIARLTKSPLSIVKKITRKFIAMQ